MPPHPPLKGRPDERGIVLILVAVAMLAILVIAAMALDLGAKRADLRSDQAVADLASLAAGSFLAGNGQETAIANPELACEAAVESAQTNVDDFAPTQDPDVDCTVFPDDAKTGCDSDDPVVHTATFSDARYVLTVRYPIPNDDAALTDARFSGGGLNDGDDPCERMEISFQQTNPTGFARIVGVNEQTTQASSIIRANTSQIGEGVAALLLLERVGCGTLQTSGGGSEGEGVVVQAPDSPPAKPNNPGVVQDDSAGIVNSTAGAPLYPCGAGSSGNANNYVVYGTGLPSGDPSIVAEPAVDGTDGIIGLFSLRVGGKGGYVFPGGLSVNPTTAQISSRQPADTKYNLAVVDGGAAQISNFHSLGYNRSNNAALITDKVLSGTQECKGNITDASKIVAQVIYVDCATFEPAQNVFPNATTFVVHGNINIKSGNVLSLPAAQNIYVRGCAVGGCSGSNTQAISVANNGALLVNTGEATVPGDLGTVRFGGGVSCSTRSGPGVGGSTTNWARIGTYGGNFPIAGLARLCQTTVYLGKNSPTYARQAVEVLNTSPEFYPTVTDCSATLPCPKISGYDASVQVSGTTDWSAPNQMDTEPEVADFATYPFEDLALWSESDAACTLRGQGVNLTEGVYFLPNANATFTGQGVQPIGINAQYFVRSLNVSSQGTLKLKPNPADAIKTPIPGALSLIR